MRKINNIKLYVNSNEKSSMVAKDLEQELKKYNFKLVKDNYDLAISIGGDGSFLRMVKENKFNDQVYYIGINSGTLGFLQEINIDECENFVKRLNNDEFKVEELNIQKSRVVTDDQIYDFESLNEIVIRNIDFKTLKMPIYIENEFFENFTGDGILISTSTGSTAYNMSFGGSVIYNTLNTLSITPIAPLNNKCFTTLANSLIIPGDKVITLKPDEKYDDLFFSVDGVNHQMQDVSMIESNIGPKKIKCIRMNDFHFIKVVNSKILEKSI